MHTKTATLALIALIAVANAAPLSERLTVSTIRTGPAKELVVRCKEIVSNNAKLTVCGGGAGHRRSEDGLPLEDQDADADDEDQQDYDDESSDSSPQDQSQQLPPLSAFILPLNFTAINGTHSTITNGTNSTVTGGTNSTATSGTTNGTVLIGSHTSQWSLQKGGDKPADLKWFPNAVAKFIGQLFQRRSQAW